MIIFCCSQAQISAQKTRFAPKISSDIRSAAGELFIGPSQSLTEMSDGPTAIGEHCGHSYMNIFECKRFDKERIQLQEKVEEILFVCLI